MAKSSERNRKHFVQNGFAVSSFVPLCHARCLSFICTTFLIVISAQFSIPSSLAYEVESDCVVRRPPSSTGNFTTSVNIRKHFDRIQRQCDIANAWREANASQIKNPGIYKEKVPMIKFGVQLATDGRDSIGHILPAIEIASERVSAMTTFRGVYIKIVPILYLDWLACDSLAILEKFNRKDVDVIFGPLNDFVLGAAARFSTALYLVPIVSPAASAVTLADKNEFGMLTRMYFTYADLKWVFGQTLQYFGWKPNASTPIGLMTIQPQAYSDSYNAGWDYLFQRQAVQDTLVSYKPYEMEIKSTERLGGHLTELAKHARIIILCADPDAVRQLMLVARELGYINGDFVFFNIDLLSSSAQQSQPWYRANESPAQNRRAMEAYRVLMTVTLRKPDSQEYLAFAQRVQERALKFYDYSFASNETNPFIGAFHDAVLLYAYALKDTLAAGGSIWNGTMLTNKMRNRTFRGITGNVSVDGNGDRNADYSLLDMNKETGNFEVVANYYGNAKEYVPAKSKTIDWGNEENKPPPDTPLCGFDGTRCRQYNILRISIGVAVGLIALAISLIACGIVMYRRARFKAELRAKNWIIPWECLENQTGNRSRHGGRTSMGYVNRKSAAVNREATAKQVPISSGVSNASSNSSSKEDRHSKPAADLDVVFRLEPSPPPATVMDETNRPIAPLKVKFEPHTAIPIGSRHHHNQPPLSTPSPPPFATKKWSVAAMRHIFRMTGDSSHSPQLQQNEQQMSQQPATQASGSPMEDSWTGTWWAKRQQRWSRKSDALSQDDSNSGLSAAITAASGGPAAAGSGSGSGWMSWLWGSTPSSGNNRGMSHGQLVGRKKSFLSGGGGVNKDSEEAQALTGRRHKLSTKHARLSKPLRKKASFGWDGGMGNYKPRRSESMESYHSYSSLDTLSAVHLDIRGNSQMFSRTTFYKGNVVSLKPLPNCRIELTNDLVAEVNKVKDLNYDHICHFVGACIEPNHQCLVYEYCPKGSLQDVLEDDQIKLDWMFKFSLMQDICRGMIYLHHNLGPHGKLKSSNCLVDSRFSLKITDFGLHLLRGPSTASPQDFAYYRHQLWTAPELLRSNSDPGNIMGSQKGDMYSFAIVCQEIIYRKGVFYRTDSLDPKEIIEKVKSPKSGQLFRPLLEASEGVKQELVDLIQSAWSDDPVARPTFTTIKVHMRKLNERGDAGNLLDNLLTRMEQYANNLEDVVAERTDQYLVEKKRVEDLLYSILPQSVASQLIKKQTVSAESFDSVTIYFSDIVEFTSLSADSTAIQVVALLNNLYTLFDSIIGRFDVYKVETIGDAYMVASGLPQRNGDNHAREIARMSIEFLKAMATFVIPHRPKRELKLRIGIHSGPVCAGVVGVKMPRYCLFGDTVNTSSRMESNGEPKKIHISQTTMAILRSFGTFIMSKRGLVEMKGKGQMETYWLHGEYQSIVYPPEPGSVLVDQDPLLMNGLPPPLSLPPLTAVNPPLAIANPTSCAALNTAICPPNAAYQQQQLLPSPLESANKAAGLSSANQHNPLLPISERPPAAPSTKASSPTNNNSGQSTQNTGPSSASGGLITAT